MCEDKYQSFLIFFHKALRSKKSPAIDKAQNIFFPEKRQWKVGSPGENDSSHQFFSISFPWFYDILDDRDGDGEKKSKNALRREKKSNYCNLQERCLHSKQAHCHDDPALWCSLISQGLFFFSRDRTFLLLGGLHFSCGGLRVSDSKGQPAFAHPSVSKGNIKKGEQKFAKLTFRIFFLKKYLAGFPLSYAKKD